MASEQELDEIKRRIDIVDLISHYVTLKKAGVNYKALCPFHEEHTGSFMVSPEKQIYKCFGCSEGGDIFNFIMKIEGLNFPETVQLLADRSGIKIEQKEKFHKNNQSGQKDLKSKLYEINSLSARYFHTILTKHFSGQEALEYLKLRRVNDQMIKKFMIGYAPKKRVLLDFLKQRNVTENDINAAGRPDRFVHRLMFPLFDQMGNVIAFTGRELESGHGPKYLNTAETVIFHKSRVLYGLNFAKIAIRQKQAVLFVEGQMDVIASHQVGIEYAVATSGTALTLDHLKMAYRYAQRFILAFDNDEAGQIATEKVIEMCLQENYTVDVIIFPSKYKDAGEVIDKEPNLWAKLIDQAIPAVEWHIRRSFSIQKDGQKLNGNQIKHISKKLLPIIKQINDSVEKQHYLSKIATRLGFQNTEEYKKFIKNEQKNLSSPPSKNTQPDRPISTSPQKLSNEEQLLSYFIFSPEAAFSFADKIDENWYKSPILSIVKEVKSWYNNSVNKDVSSRNELISSLRRKLNDQELDALEKIIASSLNPQNELEPDPALIEEEIAQILNCIKKDQYETQKLRFANLIAEAEEAGDRFRVKELLIQLQTFLQSK